MHTKQWIHLAICCTVIWYAACAPVAAPDPKASSTEPKGEPLTFAPKQHASTKMRIATAIEQVKQRDLLTTNGFWTVLHGILGLGPDVTLRNAETNERVNALDYICREGEMRGLRFYPTKYGLDVQMGPVMIGQGHQDQFIAEMAQWGIPANKKFIVFGKDYTFMDFVNHTLMRASTTDNPPQELSWAIVVIAQFLGTDIAWTNHKDEELCLEDLVRYELDASVENSACGGTHRLFGLTWVYHLHMQNGGKLEGVWKEVRDKISKYRDRAKEVQNADGSFSTDYFAGRAQVDDMDRRINTTGHIVEWLSLALSDEELKEEWMENAVNALALMILDQHNAAVDGGSLYHAVHGLLIYYGRLYGSQDLGVKKPMTPRPVKKDAEQS